MTRFFWNLLGVALVILVFFVLAAGPALIFGR